VRRAIFLTLGALLCAIPAYGRAQTPGLELPDLDGTPRSLDEHRGSIVVLNFWATWCLPCREEMPIFVRVQEAYGDRGVQVIGASADEPAKRQAVARFAREHDLTFPVWINATTRDMERFDLGAVLPATAIIDAEGRIASRILGPVEEQDLTARIEWLLGERPEPPSPPPAALPAGAAHDRGPGEEGGPPGEEDHVHGPEEKKHTHGSVAVEGGSLVPS
jgi:peroxiredoxin